MADPAKSILLVEDNPDEEAMTVRALRMAKIDHRIRVARDGMEAIESLHGTVTGEPAAPLPLVVLLDLKLPKLSGLEVLERIRAHPATRTLPVVVLTSSDEKQDVARSYRLHANSYVRKPIDFTGFVEAVRQLGAYWLTINTAPPAS